MVSRSRAGFTLNIIDTPGLVEGGYVNDQALEIIKRFVLFLIHVPIGCLGFFRIETLFTSNILFLLMDLQFFSVCVQTGSS